MRVIGSVPEMQQIARALRGEGKRVGIVPTMGSLHDGHLSLIRIAREHSDVVVTTIFVNPKQFGPSEDFVQYPRNLDRDRQLAEHAGTDILFAPSNEEIYPPSYQTYVMVEEITSVLEGKVRPGHFRGVTTVVAKLLNITQPTVAVFGQKDAQQSAAIRQMVRDLNIDVKIVVAPIVREPDGLAMSSRNVYLSPAERKDAVVLSESLQLAEQIIRAGQQNASAVRKRMEEKIQTKNSITIDYVSIADADTLDELDELSPGHHVLISLAVRIGGTRLIDNTTITIPDTAR